MPNLATLFSEKHNINAFAKQVAKDVEKLSLKSIAVNDGISTPEELNEWLEKGEKITFSYQRLIDESQAY